jgi:hypothetical protein
MTSTLTHPSNPARRSARREPGASPRADPAHRGRTRGKPLERHVLARYIDLSGCPREVIARAGSAGSVLVVDRDAATLGDRRLVAHLGADEPAENAAVVCSRYLEDARLGRCGCRRLTLEDRRAVPFAEAELLALPAPGPDELSDRHGRAHRLELVHGGMSIPELRWCRLAPPGAGGGPQAVSVREVVARLESYEPVRALTLTGLSCHRDAPGVSVTVLRVELARVLESPIVLNRALREVVLATIEREELSMSEIAIRCGRLKRDRRGNESGETSWLARRLGILPEGGRSAPTPWIHSDVLALIAWRGLGIGPREVEL